MYNNYGRFVFFSKNKRDQTFATFLYAVPYLYFLVIYPYIKKKISYIFKNTSFAILKFSLKIFIMRYRDRIPYCKVLYERKLISIKKWRQSTAYKKVKKVCSPFLVEFRFIFFYFLGVNETYSRI